MTKLEKIINMIDMNVIVIIYKISIISGIISILYYHFNKNLTINTLNKFDIFFFSNFKIIKIILIILLISCIILLQLGKRFGNMYSKKGYLSNWYDQTFKENGSDWILEIGEKILLLKPKIKKEVKIISPTGNKGKYEKALFDNWVNKGINVKMIVSDLAKVFDHEQDKVDRKSFYKYYECCDARNIQELLEKNNLNKVDIIWDYKGALWYSLTFFTKKYNYKEIIEPFYNSLEKNGMYIIDNTYYKSHIWFIKGIINLFSSINPGENSTYNLLNKKMSTDDEFKKYILERFDIKHLNPNKNKKMKAVALIKK